MTNAQNSLAILKENSNLLLYIISDMVFCFENKGEGVLRVKLDIIKSEHELKSDKIGLGGWWVKVKKRWTSFMYVKKNTQIYFIRFSKFATFSQFASKLQVPIAVIKIWFQYIMGKKV